MIFMHIRCENRNEDNESCESHQNLDPENFCSDAKKDVAKCYSDLIDYAKEAGWKYHKKEWFCASCSDFLNI